MSNEKGSGPVTITFTLEDDLKGIIVQQFTANGIAVALSESIESLLRKHVNFQNRLIDARSRRVHYSRELSAKQLQPEIKASVSEIERKFGAGENINSHLSTMLTNPDYHDALFYDWKIQHLHLGLSAGRQPRDARFVKRASDLLYVFIASSDVYFIDVLDHDPADGFANQALLQMVHGNWPHLIARHQLKGVQVVQTFTNEQIMELRKAGVMVFQPMPDGSTYAPPGGGITTAGTGMNVTIQVDMMLKQLYDAQDKVTTDIADLKRIIEAVTSKPIQHLVFGLELRGKQLVVVEKSSCHVVLHLG